MEVEIKFCLDDIGKLQASLRSSGFHERTPRTHEMNTLYDLPGGKLRRRGELLRIRKYGERWVLTHKAGRTKDGDRHKSRHETETGLEDGEALARILRSLGFEESFRYEKFRSEWTDGHGHVVIDETPIGNFAEIEGEPDWIDQVAERLEITPERYIKGSYAELFFEWKRKTRSEAQQMTFSAIKDS